MDTKQETKFFKAISDSMTMAGMLEQLGEEAAEFSQAAYKYARKLRGESPTEKTLEEIKKDYGEEWGDLFVVLLAAAKKDLYPKVADEYIDQKTQRWYDRLLAAGKIV